MILTTVLQIQPDSYDHDLIYWIDENGEKHGLGMVGKDAGGQRIWVIHIVRCPRCDNENYHTQSICVACGFDPTPKETAQ